MEINKKTYNIILILLLVAELINICFFGMQKSGYHQDEYYSYFSSNRSMGFYYPDREWVDTDTVKDEFVVKEGEGFQYGLLKLVQSWDVHPPLFYDLLHTVCSLSPGVFSKWQGIIVNLMAFILSFFILYKIAENIGMSKELRVVTLIAYGFNPMTISCVLFIRMYMWLTVFVLASALCHMKLISSIKKHYMGLNMGGVLEKEKDLSFSKEFSLYLGILMLVNFLGFLTQYYYLIFMAMIGFFFCLWFLALIPVKKAALEFWENEKYRLGVLSRFKYVVLYAVASGISLALSVLVYPASLSHIFRGYRGQEAVSAFSDSSNIIERISFFFGLAGKYLFSGMWGLLLALIILAVIALFFFIRTRAEKDTLHIAHVRILVASVGMYFLLVAKTALLLGDTSNRYEMPVYPLGILLMVYFVRIGIRAVIGNRCYKKINIAVFITFLIFVFIDVKGLFIDENVLFLYKEDKERTEYALDMKNCGAEAVVLYNDATPDNIWRLTDELLVYDRLFYVSEAKKGSLTDDDICTADSLLVYAADHENRDELIGELSKINPGYTECKEVYTKDMWTLYLID